MTTARAATLRADASNGIRCMATTHGVTLIAWLLWAQFILSDSGSWQPLAGYESQHACTQARQAKLDGLSREPGFTVREGTVLTRAKDGSQVTVLYTCLPASIDPRR